MHGSKTEVLDRDRFWPPPVIGHRGAAADAPENTLTGLRKARALGCQWVEFDVRLSADGELLLLHDDRLDRTTNGRGRVRKLSSTAIRRLDAGAWFHQRFAGECVPTLAEAIMVLSELGLGANIELKSEPFNAIRTGIAAADALSRLWPHHLPAPLISSFSADVLMAARERAPAIARGLLLRAARVKRWRLAEVLECRTVHIDHRRLNRSSVAAIRKAGYLVLAYTVNDAARACELWQWGVSSVFSDVPRMILAATPPGPSQSQTTTVRYTGSLGRGVLP